MIPPNLSAFIILQKIRNHFEWQDECYDDTVFVNMHIPESKTHFPPHRAEQRASLLTFGPYKVQMNHDL